MAIINRSNNDITNISDILKLILSISAYDTNLFACHRDLNTLDKLVNRKLELIDTYFKVYKLSLNVDKQFLLGFY